MANFRITLVGYDIVDYVSKKSGRRVQGVTVYGVMDRFPDANHSGMKCFEAFMRSVNPLDLVNGQQYDVVMDISEYNGKLQATPSGLVAVESKK